MSIIILAMAGLALLATLTALFGLWGLVGYLLVGLGFYVALWQVAKKG